MGDNMTDLDYMKVAIRLAKKGNGRVSPNPMVGAVIVKDGKIIGRGWHKRYGDLHAEREALASCTENPKGATMYVTLEPCCHFGKQPPCTDAIIQSGISRVVIGSDDPNPLVCGKGIELLRQNGITVTQNILKEECDNLNRVFFRFIQTHMPYVTMKYAMTADGKISTYTGNSKWITNERSRRYVHLERNNYSAIMVGVGTVIKDNPMLTCRIKNGRNPIRIICDTTLRTPLTSNIVSTADTVKTIIATCSTDSVTCNAFREKGCVVLCTAKKNGHVDLNDLMIRLGKEGIDSIILEGGNTLNWSAIESEIVNHVEIFIAPKIIGGTAALSPIGGNGFKELSQAALIKEMKIKKLDGDILLEGELQYVYRHN